MTDIYGKSFKDQIVFKQLKNLLLDPIRKEAVH